MNPPFPFVGHERPGPKVVYTDILQSFMLVLFVYIMVPHVDGRLLGDILSYLVITMAGAEMWQRAFAAKSRKAAKRGMFLGTAVYAVRVCMILVMALAAQQLLSDLIERYGNSDAVIPALTSCQRL